MNKNLQSPTKLTEFAPLQPEEKPQSVGQLFSKLFKINKTNTVQPDDSNVQGSNSNSDNISQESVPTWAIDVTSEYNKGDSPYNSDNVNDGRSLPNVLKRISNLLALKSNNLQDYADTELKQYWMPDSVSKECYECSEKFTTFRRRHHCRVCGQIFCSHCCNQQIPGKIFGCTGDLRVCTYCCKVVLSYLQSSDIGADLTTDLKLLQENLRTKFATSTSSPTYSHQDSIKQNLTADSHEGNNLKRKVSVGYQEEKFASEGSVTYLTNEEKYRALQNSTSLRNLYEEICKSTTGVPLDTHRYRFRNYPDCFLGSELVDWLIFQQKAKTRVQAAAICQALLDGGYIECIPEPFSFIDGYALYKRGAVLSPELLQSHVFEVPTQEEPSWVQQIPHESSTTDSDNEQLSPINQRTGRFQSSSSYTLDLNLEANTVYLSRPANSGCSIQSPESETDCREHQESTVVRPSEQREFVPESGWHNALSLRDENGEKLAYNLLTEAFEMHEQSLLKQLLSSNGLSLSWSNVITPLTHELVNKIRPDKNHDAVELDIRHYVRFKKLPGGLPSDTRMIDGIICSKNVAHKGMSSDVDNPRILLLQCSIVYQRTEGRLMSLEPVLMQEHEYLRHVAARIVALQPNVVLVQKNVSRIAQDLLRKHNITLVHNVKQTILDRLARCTQADLVTAVDAHIGRPRLGICKRFYVKTFNTEKKKAKTLMFFEGLPVPHLGSTVILRGGSKGTLTRLQKVASLLLFTVYNWRLEKSFLMDEFAQPPNSKCEFLEDSKENSPVLQMNNDILINNKKDQEGPKIKLPESTKITVETVKDFTDPLQSYRTEDEGNNQESIEKFTVSELPFSNNFRKSLDDTILCISPYLVFSVPYLETEPGKKCKLRQFFPNDIYFSEQFNNCSKNRWKCLEDETRNGNNCVNDEVPLHPFLTTKITTAIDSNNIQNLLASFRANGGRFEKREIICLTEPVKEEKKPDNNDDVLDPSNHQKLSVLFCSFSYESPNAPAFCVNPWVVCMDFYDRNDIPLGCFLERYCFRSTYMCPSKTCDTPMIKHIRRFVHNSGCVSIYLNVFDTEFSEESIVMWTWCTKCQSVSPVVPMSSDTWSYSFAKYLELKFHGDVYSRRGQYACSHSLHHDHYQYFGYKNYVASFKYTSVNIWEISLPQYTIEIKYNVDKFQNELIDEVRLMAQKGHEIFSLIQDKLHCVPNDELEGLGSLSQLLSKEQMQFKQKVEEVQLKLTSPTIENKTFVEKGNYVAYWKIYDALVRIKRQIVETVDTWNVRLSEAARKRDVDKKKDRNSQQSDLDSPVLEVKNVVPTTELSESQTDTESSSTSGNITKKNKSFDQPEDYNSEISCNDTRHILSHEFDFAFDSSNDNLLDEMEHEAFLETSTHIDDINNTVASLLSETSSDVVDTPPSPKHHRSQSDGTVITQNKETDSKKDTDKKTVKTILSQLLPSSATLTLIPNPFNTQDHYTLPTGVSVPIIVYENEPSSIVAYALNSYDYKKSFEELSNKKANTEQTPSPTVKRKNVGDKDKNEPDDKSSGILSFLRNKELLKESSSSHSQSEISQSNEQLTDKCEDLKKNKNAHIEVQFQDSNCIFFCRIYLAEKFSALRSAVLLNGEEAYIRSLSRSVQWNARGGKSGSNFAKTLDDRFILKEMSRQEVHLFLESASNYFAYMQKCCATKQPTLLGKIVGIYQIIFKNNTNVSLRTNILVMENLFYNRMVTQKFDLKGSVRNRLVVPDNQEGEIVLLDENLLKMTCDAPLYILPHSKAVLSAAIQNDTEFLSTQTVMDYSLLVGLDSENKELVLGIIDYIRTFTWDKKLETIVKKSGILGGQGKLPTIVSPEEYQKRFIEAMHKYFLEVPDHWAGLGKCLE